MRWQLFLYDGDAAVGKSPLRALCAWRPPWVRNIGAGVPGAGVFILVYLLSVKTQQGGKCSARSGRKMRSNRCNAKLRRSNAHSPANSWRPPPKTSLWAPPKGSDPQSGDPKMAHVGHIRRPKDCRCREEGGRNHLLKGVLSSTGRRWHVSGAPRSLDHVF
jgi:hypothetical protein